MTRSAAAVLLPGAPRPSTRPGARWVLAGIVLGLLLAVPGVLLMWPASPTTGLPRQPAAPVARDIAATASTWGDRFTWADGLAVTVAAPVPCVPAPDAAPARVDRAVRFRVTVLNRGPVPFDAGEFSVLDDASFDGRGADPVIDTNGPCGNGGLDAIAVLPGRSYSYDLSYAVGAAPGAVRLTFQPAPDAPRATFAGRA